MDHFVRPKLFSLYFYKKLLAKTMNEKYPLKKQNYMIYK